ncbi:MAG: FAD-dependent oxidoreductase [Oscillospiraceae bacterium]|jgi:NADPH-dependent glutamate synthase beta subunit-like oxidoreductase|nr:FAD-dependent oxidoreductase [Oscillospiraceae bacterium]
MSRLKIRTKSQAQELVDNMYAGMERRIAASPSGLCPIDITLSFLNLCHAQSCGKCTPCRIGLGQLSALLRRVLDGEATMETLEQIKLTARNIVDSADCAIGFNAATLVLNGMAGFEDDFKEHILRHQCLASHRNSVPCITLCPAGVDVPGYISLIADGRPADAVRLILKDNPFPLACAYICEHPCESRCRRSMIDDPVNIRALKKFAVKRAGALPTPPCAEDTGKRVAIIGGGPSGLSAAYYLRLMGHAVTVFEKHKRLGGMLRYGIPSYRLPRTELDKEINAILAVGVETHTEVEVGKDITMEQIKAEYDAVYIAIGAQTDRKAGIPGEDSGNVISAVELLRSIGDEQLPDLTGKKVIVIGGGNVAMDVNRSAVRLGAEKVSCVYRRRQSDMTALPEEIEGTIAEGVELYTMVAPVRIEADENGNAVALWVRPQDPGVYDKSGRPSVSDSEGRELRLEADLIILAVGQGIESRHFEESGITVKRGSIMAGDDAQVGDEKIFAGGDCVTGPATAIRAIAAGKVAAANIDEFLGFKHEISTDVVLPAPKINSVVPRGRVNLHVREVYERKKDFKVIELGMSCQQAELESSRCLHCDYFGFGNFRGGRETKW